MRPGDGLRALSADMIGASSQATRMAHTAAVKAALDTQAEARRRAPVDTGYMRASIAERSGVQGRTVWAETSVGAEYAAFVEYGTSTQAPQPFMRPAFEQAKGVFVQMIGQIGGPR